MIEQKNKNNNINEDLSVAIYRVRGLAIFLVCLCHCPYDNQVLNRAASIIGLIGVPAFLICSGIYFKPKKWVDFLTSRLRKIVIPWMIWGGHYIRMERALWCSAIFERSF